MSIYWDILLDYVDSAANKLVPWEKLWIANVSDHCENKQHDFQYCKMYEIHCLLFDICIQAHLVANAVLWEKIGISNRADYFETIYSKLLGV